MMKTVLLLVAFAAAAHAGCVKGREVEALNLDDGTTYCRSNGLGDKLASVLQDGAGSRECPFDVSFIIDESGSINDEGFANIRLFIKAVMATFLQIGSTGTHFGVTQFSGIGSGTTDSFDLGAYTTQAEYYAAVDAITRTAGSGPGAITGTCISCGILRATERQAAHDAALGADHLVLRKKVFMVLTDGRTTPIDKFARPKASADAARASGVTIFAIGVGNQVSDTELSNIANDPDSDYKWIVSNFEQLLTLGGLIGVGLECGGDTPPPDVPPVIE